MDSLLKDLVLSEESAVRWEKARRAVIATTWFFLTMVLAIEIPDISAVINMLGSLAAVFIFVFPGICLLQTAVKRYSDSSSHSKNLNFSSATLAWSLELPEFVLLVPLPSSSLEPSSLALS